MVSSWLIIGCCPRILSAPIFILSPPLGTLDMFWAMNRIPFFTKAPDFWRVSIGYDRMKQLLSWEVQIFGFQNPFPPCWRTSDEPPDYLPSVGKIFKFGGSDTETSSVLGLNDLFPADWIEFLFIKFPSLLKEVTKDNFHFIMKRRRGLIQRKSIKGERRNTRFKEDEPSCWIKPNWTPLLHLPLHFVNDDVPSSYLQRF